MRLIAAAVFCLALSAYAQSDRPKSLQPLPEAPPLPQPQIDPSLEPEVTIIKRGTEIVEEYRVRGRLYMIKVTPSHGVPYYLIDEAGHGKFTRRDNLDNPVSVPLWLILEF